MPLLMLTTVLYVYSIFLFQAVFIRDHIVLSDLKYDIKDAYLNLPLQLQTSSFSLNSTFFCFLYFGTILLGTYKVMPIIFSWLIAIFIIIYYHSLSYVVLFGLNYILLGINITTLVFLKYLLDKTLQFFACYLSAILYFIHICCKEDIAEPSSCWIWSIYTYFDYR